MQFKDNILGFQLTGLQEFGPDIENGNNPQFLLMNLVIMIAVQICSSNIGINFKVPGVEGLLILECGL